MKKFTSIFISLIMVFALCVPALAANEAASFVVNVLSETDSQAFLSIDYNGGQSFNCLDFEVKLSDRVSVKSCANGAGLRNFKIYVDDLDSEDLTISSYNKEGNPIKFTFATTVKFKVVNGKDLLTLTLNKKSAAKLTSDDVKLTITNCGISADDLSTTSIKTSVVQIGNKESTTLKSPDQVGTAAEKTSTPAPVGEVTSAAQETTLNVEETSTDVENSELTPVDENNETEQNDSSNKKKIIIVAAAAFCLVIVIGATVIYIVKKSKKEE